MSADIVIIAALEREVRPLVRGWRKHRFAAGDLALPAFSRDNVLLVCCGIGAEFARRAAVAVFSSGHPRVVVSAGLAGALDPSVQVGQVFRPEIVIDQSTGARFTTCGGTGVLVSVTSVLGRAAKQRLRGSYAAIAADMESAAVGLVAGQNGCPFVALKAISDPVDFSMPPLERFIDHRGQISTVRLIAASVFQPWNWSALARLGVNSARASRELSKALEHLIEEETAAANGQLSPACH